MATVYELDYSLAAGQEQMLSEVSYDTVAKKKIFPAAVDVGGSLGVTGDISVTGLVDDVDVAAHAAASSGVHGASGDLVGTIDTQILSNKTLTLPQFNDTSLDHQYVLGVSELSADRTITLPLLTGNDTFVFGAHAQTLTNKTIDADSNTISNLALGAEVSGGLTDLSDVAGETGTGTTVVMQTNPTLTGPTVSGDIVFDEATNDLTLAVTDQATGPATATIPSLGGVSQDFVFTAAQQTLTNKVLTTPQINDTSSDHQYVVAVSELAADRTVTLPLLIAADTFVFASHIQTLVGKTIDGDSNTVQNLPYSSIKSTSRTGIDTKLVTGTAGTTGNAVSWDANGDVIDSGLAIANILDTSSALGDLGDVTVTSAAAYDVLYRNAGNTAWINLAKGSEGEVLGISGGSLAYIANGVGTMSSFDLAGDTGTPQTITDGNTLSVLTGYGLTSAAAATDKVTVSVVPSVTGVTVCPVTADGDGLGTTIDNATLAHTAGTLKVHDGGITGTQLATALTKSFSGGVVSFAASGELTVAGATFSGTQVPNADWVLDVAEGLVAKGSVIAGTIAPLVDNASITGTPTYNPVTSTDGLISATLAVSGVFTVDGIAMSSDDRLAVLTEEQGTAQISSVDTRADSSGDLNNDYFVMYYASNRAAYVWYNVNGAGVDPTPSAPAGVTYTGIEVAVATNATADAVASATDTALNAFEYKAYLPFSSSVITNALTITNLWGGLCTNVAEGAGTSFTFNTDTPGTGMGPSANGLWIVTITGTALTMVRAADWNSTPTGEVTPGAFFCVTEGTINEYTSYLVTTRPAPLVPGTAAGDVMLFTILARAGEITASTGLVRVANDIRIKPDVTTGVTRSPILIDASNGASVGVDNDTIKHTEGVLSVGPNSIGPAELDETANYAFTSVTLNLTGVTTLSIPTVLNFASGNAFTFTEQSNMVLAPYAAAIAEKLANAAAGGVAEGEVVYIKSDETIGKAISSLVAAKEGFMGIAAEAASEGNPVAINKNCRCNALFIGSLTPAVGQQVFVASTAGRLTTNISGWLAGSAIIRAGHITDTLTYDGISDFMMEIELKQHAPIWIL